MQESKDATAVSENLAQAPAQEETIEIETGLTALLYSNIRLVTYFFDVSFNWEKQQLMGKVELTLKPYFYSTDKLELDAKGFELRAVSLKSGDGLKHLSMNMTMKKSTST